MVLLGGKCLAFDEYAQERDGSLLSFLKDAPRIKAEDSVEAIGDQLESLAGQAGLKRPVVCRTSDGRIAWGIHYVSAKANRAYLVYLINLGREAKTVSLFSDDKSLGKAVDLFSNEKNSSAEFVLKPYEMRLLSIAGE